MVFLEEEVTQKVIALSVNTARFTVNTFRIMLQKYLAAQQRGHDPFKHGKQSVKDLIGQNTGVTNIEITDGNIKSFEKYARKYGIDFALKKDSSQDPPRYLVFFKSRDTDAMHAAFKEFLNHNLKEKDKPSIREKLLEFKKKLENVVKKEKILEKKKEKGLGEKAI